MLDLQVTGSTGVTDGAGNPLGGVSLDTSVIIDTVAPVVNSLQKSVLGLDQVHERDHHREGDGHCRIGRGKLDNPRQ